MALLVVLLVVFLNLAAAVVLKTMADLEQPAAWMVGVGILAVLGLGLLRVLAWGYAHRRFPLSTTYPLSSLFYPLMLVVSFAFDEPVGGTRIAGCLLITTGVVWLATRKQDAPSGSAPREVGA